MKPKLLLIFLLLTTAVFSQKLIVEYSDLFIIKKEIEALKSKTVKEELYINPFIEKSKNKIEYLNILKKLNLKNKFVVEPVASIRLSRAGFEMLSHPSNALWISPGLKFHSILPLMTNFKSIWLYSWANFYKHSAILEDVFIDSVDDDVDLFANSPDYSTSFFTQSLEPDNSFDFDQSNAGVALLSSNFELIFGKFKSNFGPFQRGNLSISDYAPAFNQFLIKLKFEKLNFTYLLGKLNSNIPRNLLCESIGSQIIITEENIHSDFWDWGDCSDWWPGSNELSTDRHTEFNRYVAHHRIDILPKKNIRIGLYEQVVFGGRDIAFNYMIPVVPFWSVQHESGDTDNIMMGVDFEVIFGKKDNESNRFYSALLIDEWAPYDTFKDNNRNWFAYQIGYSRNAKISGKDFLFKIEYAKIEPEVYNHRFIINEAKHFGYNLGFWSGRNSDDIIVKFILLINKYSYVDLGYEYTRFSNDDYISSLESQYDYNNVDFLSGNDYFFRKKGYISYSTLLKYSLFLDVELSNINIDYGNFSYDDIYDINCSIRYNISN